MKEPSYFFLLLFIAFFGEISQAQIYFNEDFNYSDYNIFKIIGENRERWTFFHAENQDFNNNRYIDNWEDIKSINFLETNKGNRAIQFNLRRMDDVILREDVMEKGNINGVEVDYLTFFTHVNRNEIATWDNPNTTAYRPNRKYNFEFEIMIPDDFEFENENCDQPSKANYEITGKWHLSHAVLNGHTMPPISLRIVCDEWMLNLNPENNSEEKDEDFISLGKIEKGKWTSWKFNFRLSHKNKGFIHINKDNELVYSQINSKTVFERIAADGNRTTFYFKIGVYKPHWWSRDTKVSERKVLFNNVKVYR